MSNPIVRAQIILCGAIGKAQRGQPWTEDHPAQAVDALVEAFDARIELAIDKLRKEMVSQIDTAMKGARDGWWEGRFVALSRETANLEQELKTATAAAIRLAVLAEREECARECPAGFWGDGIAKRIRSRP